MAKNKSEELPPFTEFEWIQLKEEIHKAHPTETVYDKIIRKSNENPFVPIGCIGTAVILTMGLLNMRKNRPDVSQKLMRLRVVAQGLTIVALITGVTMGVSK